MDRRVLLLLVAITAAFGVSLVLQWRCGPDDADDDDSAASGDEAAGCQRVIALAPSLTETMYALGLGERVVGVSSFSNYPPEVEEKPDVGGYFDPNYEVMLGLEPDLVLVLPEHDQVKEHLRALQVPMLQVSHADLDGVMASFGTIGEACGAAPRADEVAASIRAEMERVERATAGLARPKVLLLVGRTHGVGHIEDPYIVGNEGFYDELIRIAGGTNVYEGEVRFPSVSGEGLLHMDPDVIVDLVPDLGALSLTEEQLIADWDALPGLRAVQTGRVHVLEGDHVMIPGPRFPRIIEDLTALLHPELDLDGS